MESYSNAIFVSSVNLGSECIQVYDADSGTCLKSYRGTCLGSKTLCPVGSSDFIMSSQKDKPFLEAWPLNQHDSLQMRFPVRGRVSVMAVNHAGPKYCLVGIQEKIYVYQLQSGHLLGIIGRHYQAVTCLNFTSCGNYFASAGADGFIYLWSKRSLIDNLHKEDRPQIQPHYILGQHLEKVTGISISSSGIRGLLVSCSLDRSCKIFDMVTGRLRHNLILPAGITSVCFNIIGSQVFCASAGGKVWGINLLPIPVNKDIQVDWSPAKCHEKAIHHICTTVSGVNLITGSDDGDVKLWTIVVDSSSKERTTTFAFQKTLHVGRGAITNLLTMKIEREILNATELPSMVVLTPFASQTSVDILSAEVAINLKPNLHPLESRDYIEMATTLLEQDTLDVPIEEKMKNRKSKKSKRMNNSSETNGIAPAAPAAPAAPLTTDHIANIRKLRKSNRDLYKLCVTHVIGEKK